MLSKTNPLSPENDSLFVRKFDGIKVELELRFAYPFCLLNCIFQTRVAEAPNMEIVNRDSLDAVLFHNFG